LSRAILYGFAGAGVVVSIMAVIYSQSRELFLSPIFQWSLLIPYLIAMILVLMKRPPYFQGEAIRAALVVFLIVNACYYLYTFLLYEVIDQSLYQLQSDLMIANSKEHGLGTPGDVSQLPEVMYAPESLKYTLGKVMLWYAQGAIFGAAIAFLMGTLLGKKDPDYLEVSPPTEKTT